MEHGWVYLIIAAAGVVVLLFGLLSGHDSDHDLGHDVGGGDHGDLSSDTIPSVFSLKVLGCVLTGFGFGTLLAFEILAEAPTRFAIANIMGIIVGFVMGLIGWLAMFALLRLQSCEKVNDADFEGQEGVITSGTVDGVGTVVVVIDGNRFDLTAKVMPDGGTVVQIPYGARVRVVRKVGLVAFVERI